MPALTIEATLHPFAAWPVDELHASTQALDLSALASMLPATSLGGDATLTSPGRQQPATLSIALKNARPGRWNEGRLPVRSVALEVVGRPDDVDALSLRRLDIELGNAHARAGRVTGTGHWSRERWSLEAALHGVRAEQLDARAGAFELSGPVQLASSGASGAGSVDVKAELGGALGPQGPARAVTLVLDGRFSPRRVELHTLRAQAGKARAELSGQLSRAADTAPWVVKAKAALVDFDPTQWWAGRSTPKAAPGPSRLNAQASVDFSVPATALAGPLAALPGALRGATGGTLARLTLTDSVLAGVPLRGEATLLGSGDGSQALPTLTLDAGGNRVHAQGQFATRGPGVSDTLELRIDAAALERLAPLLDLFQAGGTTAGLAGNLSASARIDGRWPEVTSEGRLEASALRVGAARVQHAQARWKGGTAASAALDVSASAAQVSWVQGTQPTPIVESAQLQLTGTAQTHTLELSAASRALPPAWTEVLQPAPPEASASASAPPTFPRTDTTAAAPALAASSPAASGAARTTALLRARGGLVGSGTLGLSGWRGAIEELDLRRSGAAPLLHSAKVGLEFMWAGGPARASVQPGRAEVLGGALHWSGIGWQAAGGPGGSARIDAEVEIEPIRVAPLLARLQRDFGWGGDLSVGGHLKLHSAPTFSADVVLERRAGDLTVTDELGTQALGLTDLRLALNAENGVWSFTQALAGKTLGVAAGAVVARTSPRASWPAADTPIEGVLELRVASLGTWGNWVPPGWRVDGALHASASLAGTFGAPEYTGEVRGTRLAVRNFLQGVNVTDGDLAINLRGNTAHIEHFSAKAGSGTLRLEGDASLGAAPEAQLRLTAERARILGRVDRRIVASGQAQLRLDARTFALSGRLQVDEGLIDFTRSDAPSLSDDVHVVRTTDAAPGSSLAPVAPARAMRSLVLDLRVDLGTGLRIRGHGLDTGLRGELHITSPAGRLAVNGTVSTANGSFDAYGQKLTIDRGQVIFSGSIESPRLDIVATRPNLDVRVGVAVSGTTANPRVRLFSEPEMSEIDKLSWLVMGRASSGLGRGDTALLQRAALALLAGEGGGPTDKITQALGLDEISLSQSEGAVSDTVISLGKQLSRRWYVGYERGLNATAGTWQLIYRIAQRFTLRAQSGLDNSIDLIWTWRWQ